MQIDCLSRPARPHRRWRRNQAGVGIESAERIGLPAFGRVGVKQKIMKVPEHEVVVALGRAEPMRAFHLDPEQDLAIDQQRQQLHAGETVLAPQPADFLRGRERGEGGRDAGVANPEQRTGARRFQHHLVAAPPQVGKPRQHDRFGRAEFWRSRPIIRKLRFDDDLVFLGGPERGIPGGRSGPAAAPADRFPGRRRGPCAQMLPAAGRRARSCARSSAPALNFPSGQRVVVEAGQDISVRAALRV